MAHGSKKWIVAYDGRIKRSNDRTKKDYYRDLHWFGVHRSYRRHDRHQKKDGFCPQCKHVAKEAKRIEALYKGRDKRLHQEYHAKFEEALEVWRKYRNHDWWYHDFWDDVGVPRRPPHVPEPPHYWNWYKEQTKDDPMSWSFDARSFLCYKCERKYEVKCVMWDDHIPGHKDRYHYTVRQEYKNYRNAVRNLMRQAKYNEDLYDDIGPNKHGWLD